tara:strand:+ start:1529 stop:2296 length:768 start_codon:yes stop_codon:yes gene_type:complete
MKAVILAGGLGTRISEESSIKPKPMIEVGGKPILWHIMKIYSSHGINDFVICCGYKGYLIKEYFSNYFMHMSDITVDLNSNKVEVHHKRAEPWKITLVDTGETTQTGGRLKKVKDYLDDDFCMTYGDGLSSIDIKALVNFHKNHENLATITAVQPPGRFGSLVINKNNKVESFIEKPQGDGGWINGGFFVLKPSVIDFIESDATIWEKDPLEKLAEMKELNCFIHDGFWRPMDTLRDKTILEDMWMKDSAPWKTW